MTINFIDYSMLITSIDKFFNSRRTINPNGAKIQKT
jgi:hypothetical protein